MAETTTRKITWGGAILASFLVFFALVVLFGIAPSQFITTVNKSYGKVPNSRQSRFVRDLVSGGYHVAMGAWLIVGVYHIQLLAKRSWRIAAHVVLLVLPCVVFALVPSILHGFINAYVASRPAAEQGPTLYSGDLWVYTGYFFGATNLFLLLTGGWIFGLPKIEARLSGQRPTPRSAFGRPVVTPT